MFQLNMPKIVQAHCVDKGSVAITLVFVTARPSGLGKVSKISFGLSPLPVIVEMKVYRDSLLKM